jgi:hypothetical protein
MVAWLAWLGVGLALAESPYKAKDASMHTTAVVRPPPAEAVRRLTDLEHMRELLERVGAGCARDLDVGEPTAGLGAAGRITWTPSWMDQRMTLRVSEVSDTRVVWDHSRRLLGFYMIFRVAPEGDGSRVTVEVPVEPMPWPVRKIWFEQILPRWQSCLASALAGL